MALKPVQHGQALLLDQLNQPGHTTYEPAIRASHGRERRREFRDRKLDMTWRGDKYSMLLVAHLPSR